MGNHDVVGAVKASVTMVAVQFAHAVVNILFKLAANDGMNFTILVAYRFFFGTAFMSPIAFVFERKDRNKLTGTVLFQAFLCGLFGGTLAQNLYIESLALTSATYVTAIGNLIPVITFILAVFFGMEKLGLGTVAGKAKVVGTLIGIGGTMLLTFYKGFEVNIWSSHVKINHRHHHLLHQQDSSAADRILGSLLSVGSCLCFAFWLTIQTKMSERYPCPYTTAVLMSFMGSIQAVVYALCRERDWTQWRLGWNIRLLTVAFSGIVSGVSITLVAWCLRLRGPVFVSAFNPLSLVMVALASSMVLDEKLHLGSILGSGLIVLGLYAVLWGKNDEAKRSAPPSVGTDELQSVEIIANSPEKDNGR